MRVGFNSESWIGAGLCRPMCPTRNRDRGDSPLSQTGRPAGSIASYSLVRIYLYNIHVSILVGLDLCAQRTMPLFPVVFDDIAIVPRAYGVIMTSSGDFSSSRRNARRFAGRNSRFHRANRKMRSVLEAVPYAAIATLDELIKAAEPVTLAAAAAAEPPNPPPNRLLRSVARDEQFDEIRRAVALLEAPVLAPESRSIPSRSPSPPTVAMRSSWPTRS